MKIRTIYPGKARKAKTILVAGLVLMQASLMANDSSDVNRNYNATENVYNEYAGNPSKLNVENINYYLNEKAFEAEYEIEDWMFNVYSDYLNTVTNEEAVEPEIKLEEWMSDIQDSFWLDLDEAQEQEPAIECWMTDPKDWIDTEDESVLSLK